MKHCMRHIIKKKCKGATLPEILVVIILSGILFLLVFDGMNIIHKYNRIFAKRLILKNEVFYSHSILELIMEETDSIRTSGEDTLLLFYKAGDVKCSLSLNKEGFHISYKELKDTIFINNLGWRLGTRDEKKHEIDSLFVIAPLNEDTLILEYGLSSHLTSLNTDKEHATI